MPRILPTQPQRPSLSAFRPSFQSVCRAAALVLALSLGSFNLSTATALAAQPAKAAAHPVHQLVPPQIRLLKALGSAVVVPTYLPKDFELDGLYLEYTHPGPGGGPGYELRYRCFCEGQNQSLIVRGSTGGFGGPGGDEHFAVKNPQLGAITVEYFKPGGLFADLKQGYYFSDWVGKGPLYFSILTGSGNSAEEAPPPARTELIKVLQGLRYLP